MNVQIIAVIVLFVVALVYLGWKGYKSLTTKKSCGENCKCGIDFSNIEQLKADK
ncbi:MAG: FeoB-associated Cys-rich membrane protein [Bacteroidetes bacterium]|nr:FeoB-associated Cys-rich membrane protein [Bacteroidota bacterium]